MKKIILGILVLGISLLLAGCGTEEGTETENLSETETGAYAVDFTAAPGVVGFITLDQPTDSVQSLKDKELTVEAWVKTKQDPVNKTLELPPYGSIFSHGRDWEGILLWIDSNQKLVFTMEDFPGPSSLDNRRHDIISASVDGDGKLDEPNMWYHIAAVLVNEDHTGLHAACGGAEAETPHVDIYINGVFDNCGSSGGNFTGDLDYIRKELGTCTGYEGVDYVNVDVDGDGSNDFCYPLDKDGNKFKFTGSIGRFQADWWWPSGALDRPKPDRRFVGIIDEVRLWNVARAADQISENYKREIEPQYGLIGYWRLNEGEGNIIIDSSNSGKGGVKMYCNVQGYLVTDGTDVYTKAGTGCAGPLANALPWENGWVAGDWE